MNIKEEKTYEETFHLQFSFHQAKVYRIPILELPPTFLIPNLASYQFQN
jgi:hypothetical protein